MAWGAKDSLENQEISRSERVSSVGGSGGGNFGRQTNMTCLLSENKDCHASSETKCTCNDQTIDMILGLSEGRCPENYKLIEIFFADISEIRLINQQKIDEYICGTGKVKALILSMIEVTSVQKSHCLVKLTLQKN